MSSRPRRKPNTTGRSSRARSTVVFFQKDSDKPAQYPSVVIAVDSIEDATKKVEKAGGKALGEPMDIPGIGRYVSFTDTEGNRVSMLQPLHDMKH